MTPQAVTDALNTLQEQKDVADTALSAKNDAAAALTAAEAANVAAASTLKSASDSLDMKRQQLEAILDSFYTVGGTI